MKKSHFPATLKIRTTVLFCALFAFFTSVSAQNEASKKLDQIKEFRTHCTELLNILPAVSTVQASSGFTLADKQKLISVIKTIKEASQIEDNTSDAAFSRLKKNVEGVRNWLESFEPASTTSSARANDSPQNNSPSPQDCQKTCDDNYAYSKKNCNLLKKLGADQKEVDSCFSKALGTVWECRSNCTIQH